MLDGCKMYDSGVLFITWGGIVFCLKTEVSTT